MDRPKRILIVDDNESVRKWLKDTVEFLGHEPELARDGFEALAKLELDIDLVLVDLEMPGMDGFEVIRRIRQHPDAGDLPIIMVTGFTTEENVLRSIEAGASDFISKPVGITELRIRAASLLKMKEARDTIKRHKVELEVKVKKKTAQLRKALEEAVEARRRSYEAYQDTIHRLILAAEYKDEGTAAHIRRISELSALLARTFHLPPGEVELIKHASPMHDVGKIAVSDAILLKPGKLDEQEWIAMRAHTTAGGHILSESPSELLQAGKIIALSHHEKWDGSGYPKGLAGEDIPTWGRICAIADVFDALTSDRPYKKAFSNERSLQIMKEGQGKHFDPELLDLFIGRFDEVVAIQKQYCEGSGA